MKNINFSFPQEKFRKNDLFLELKSKNVKGKYMKKVSLLALSGIIALALSGCGNDDGVSGKVARSFKEACQNSTTEYDWLVADVKYKLINTDKDDRRQERYVVYDKDDQDLEVGGIGRYDLQNYAQFKLTHDFDYAKIKVRGKFQCIDSDGYFDKAPANVKPLKKLIFFSSANTTVEEK